MQYNNQSADTLGKVESSVIESILEQANLYWAVKKEPLFLSDGVETPYFAHVRQDTGGILGSSKGSYEVFQNWESAELIARVCDKTGFVFHGGGSFSDGKQIYLQLLTQSYKGIGTNNDRIDNFATVINSFDGTTSLRWGLSNITISCKNTFWAAYSQSKNKVTHTKNMRTAIDNALFEVDRLVSAEKTLYERLFKLADIEASDKHIKKVVKVVTGLDPDKKVDDLKKGQLLKAERLASDINREISEKGKTLWGLFSGVTRYTTHSVYPTLERREKSKAIGTSGDIDNLIYKILSADIEELVFDGNE
jgi:hypothetical protein